MSRIVVLDGYTVNPGDNSWAPLAALGELSVYDRSAPSEVVARAQGAEEKSESWGGREIRHAL